MGLTLASFPNTELTMRMTRFRPTAMPLTVSDVPPEAPYGLICLEVCI